MTRVQFAATALLASLALIGRTPKAALGDAAHCLHVPVMPAHADERYVVVLATGTRDTVLAGWGDVRPSRTEQRPRGWATAAVYGQVAHVADVGGPAAAGMTAGRAELVPWQIGCDDRPVQWYGSFVWLRPGEPDAIVGRLRKREDWAGGIPTIDVHRPDLMRASGMLPGAVGWKATAGELFGFYATIPTADRIRAEPWPALAAMRAWLAANAQAARDPPIRLAARGIHQDAANAEVRAAPSPLAGTYRFQVSRTGGPTHTIHVRTASVPARALGIGYDSVAAALPGSAPGYEFTVAARQRASALPSPRPALWTRVWRRITGTPHEGWIQVRLPEVRGMDGSRIFAGHLDLWNYVHLFRRDPELGDWIGDWSRRWSRSGQVGRPTAEIVLRPNGAVEWVQVMEVAPGRVVTIRGVRISEVALEMGDR